MSEEVEISEKTQSSQYFAGAGLSGLVMVAAGGMVLLRRTEQPTYQKVQKTLDNAPARLQGAVDTFISAYQQGDTTQMKKSLDETVTAQNNIARSYKFFLQERGQESHRQETPIHLMGLHMDAKISLESMNHLYKGSREVTTLEGTTEEIPLKEEYKEQLLDAIMNQSCRIPYDATVQQIVDGRVIGREQHFFEGVSLMAVLVAGFCLYKGIRAWRKEKTEARK